MQNQNITTEDDEMTHEAKKHGKKSKAGGLAWQNVLANPSQRLGALHNNSRLADLTICFPGHDLPSIKAHRLVLAMSSPVFEAMLFGPLAEGPELYLHEDPPEAFEWLLEYVYKGQTQLPGVRQAVQIYQLASKYQMEPLIKLCSDHLRASLTASNLPEMYDTAVLLEDNQLLERCTEVVNRSPRSVLTSPSFGRLSRSALSHLLQNPLHISSEVILFDALVTWGKCQPNSSSLREEIKDFLSKVRFLVMTTDEFVEHVMPTGVLTLEEMSDILMNIKLLTNIPLPSLCSSIREKRKLYVENLMRTLTLTTIHRFPKQKRGSSGSRQSILVHNTHEQILLMNFKTNVNIQLGRITCKALNPTSGGCLVAVKDGDGEVIDSGTSDGHKYEVYFDTPITIEANIPHSVTVCMEGHWPRGELGEFKAADDDIEAEGNIAYTEGRSGTVLLHYWSFN
ncbi:BTB/POZ domain-containing protein 6-B-like isoform X1 [Macrobrachium rosenbergii]|uniref:BTB/POZ domain-containing protein 6-B-like isoform X1 n=2 Tax=Macrobrachium rosenbergii TaxID=79674 RepID=UPI0034D6FD68